jgi:hypothetical protein
MGILQSDTQPSLPAKRVTVVACPPRDPAPEPRVGHGLWCVVL